jgi:hypothetical protein
MESQDTLFCPSLVARAPGKLIGTWFSRRDQTLETHVAVIELGANGTAPRFVAGQPFVPDTWGNPRGSKPGDPPMRLPLGEYLAPVVLKSGGFGVLNTIQNETDKRFGFVWRRFELR